MAHNLNTSGHLRCHIAVYKVGRRQHADAAPQIGPRCQVRFSGWVFLRWGGGGTRGSGGAGMVVIVIVIVIVIEVE